MGTAPAKGTFYMFRGVYPHMFCNNFRVDMARISCYNAARDGCKSCYKGRQTVPVQAGAVQGATGSDLIATVDCHSRFSLS